jgi:tripartite-type tricarboxylate transporter receptor subunit TctC
MRLTQRRRLLARVVAAGLTQAVSWTVRAQPPLETVRIVTGFPPGGTSDTLCRRVADALRSSSYAKAAVVDNKPGAGGQLALEQMRIAPADGSVILQTPASMLMIYPHVYRRLNYDPFNDVTPVTLAATFGFGLAVGPAVPESVRTVSDFVAFCKAHPERANFGTPGAGSVPHFLGILLSQASGAEIRHVPFRGSQPAILDMIAGQLSAVSAPEGEFFQHVKSGRIRLLATSGSTRSHFSPDTPTYVEQGYPNVHAREWFGFFLPGKPDPEVIQRTNAALRAALATQTVIEGLATMGLEATSCRPDELRAQLRRDFERWGAIVRASGFSAG